MVIIAAITGFAVILLFWGMVLLITLCGNTHAASEIATIPTFLGLNWGEIVKAVTGVCTVYIAAIALKNWSKQSIAKSRTDFLDSLLTNIIEFGHAMDGATEHLQFMQFGIDGHSGDDLSENGRISGAISYIDAEGPQEAKTLLDVLKKSDPLLVKIKTLEIKGTILNFSNYEACRRASSKITAINQQMLFFCVMMGRSGTNWKNIHARRRLGKVINLDSGKMKKEIQTAIDELTAFAKQSYKDAHS